MNELRFDNNLFFNQNNLKVKNFDNLWSGGAYDDLPEVTTGDLQNINMNNNPNLHNLNSENNIENIDKRKKEKVLKDKVKNTPNPNPNNKDQDIEIFEEVNEKTNTDNNNSEVNNNPILKDEDKSFFTPLNIVIIIILIIVLFIGIYFFYKVYNDSNFSSKLKLGGINSNKHIIDNKTYCISDKISEVFNTTKIKYDSF